MAIYQPSNVIPSSFAGVGLGVVDVNNNILISWQVNGNSPMTAFRIQIYNNASSTNVLVKDTNIISLTAPYYGVDNKGNPQQFSTSEYVKDTTWANWGLSNGNEYKMVITQYWGTPSSSTPIQYPENQSAVQWSGSVFTTQETPSVLIAFSPELNAEGQGTVANQGFTASVTPDSTLINSVKWQFGSIEGSPKEGVEINDSLVTILDDTGAINTSVLEYAYDGLFSGNTYAIKCTVETQDGLTVSTGWQAFEVNYVEAETSAENKIAVECLADDSVLLSWAKAKSIQGEISPSGTQPTVKDGLLLLNENETVTWDKINDEAMNIEPPYTVAWKGELCDIKNVQLSVDVYSKEKRQSFDIDNLEPDTFFMKTTAYYTDFDDEKIFSTYTKDGYWFFVTAASAKLYRYYEWTGNIAFVEQLPTTLGTILSIGYFLEGDSRSLRVIGEEKACSVILRDDLTIMTVIEGSKYSYSDAAACGGKVVIRACYRNLRTHLAVAKGHNGTWELPPELDFDGNYKCLCAASHGDNYFILVLEDNSVKKIYINPNNVNECSVESITSLPDSASFVYSVKSAPVSVNAYVAAVYSRGGEYWLLYLEFNAKDLKNNKWVFTKNPSHESSSLAPSMESGGGVIFFTGAGMQKCLALYSTNGTEWSEYESEHLYGNVSYGNGNFMTSNYGKFSLNSIIYRYNLYYDLDDYFLNFSFNWGNSKRLYGVDRALNTEGLNPSINIQIDASKEIGADEANIYGELDITTRSGQMKGSLIYKPNIAGIRYHEVKSEIPNTNVESEYNGTTISINVSKLIGDAYESKAVVSVDLSMMYNFPSRYCGFATFKLNDDLISIGIDLPYFHIFYSVEPSLNKRSSGIHPYLWGNYTLYGIVLIKNDYIYFYLTSKNGAFQQGPVGLIAPSNQLPITSLKLIGEQACDWLYVGNGDINIDGAFSPKWTEDTLFLADFLSESDALQAGTFASGGSVVNALYRIDEGDDVLKPIYSVPTNINRLKDYGLRSGKSYAWELFYLDGETTYSTPIKSSEVCKQLRVYVLIEASQDKEFPNVYHVVKTWRFGNNLSVGGISNNNTPNWLTNFTPYRLRQPSSRLGQSGTLQALLSNYNQSENFYKDTIEMMNELKQASASLNTFFLKDMKGNLYMVGISGPITQTVSLKSKIQEVTISVPWEEVGDATNVALIQLPTDEGWTRDQVLEMKFNANAETGILSAEYPENYVGTTFEINDREELLANTQLYVKEASFELENGQVIAEMETTEN